MPHLSEKEELSSTEVTPFIGWTPEYKTALNLLYGSTKPNNTVEKNPEVALKLLLAESAKGNVLATHDVGKIYSNQLVDVPDGKKLGQKYYAQALDGFHKLLSADDELLKNHHQILPAKELKKKLWEREYICYHIGRMYDKGLGTEQDCTVARKYYEIASPFTEPGVEEPYLSEKEELSSTEAIPFIEWTPEYKAALDLLYGSRKPNNTVEKNPEEALKLLLAESVKGNVLATHDIGKIYSNQLVDVPDGKKLGQKYYAQALDSFHKLLSADNEFLKIYQQNQTDEKIKQILFSGETTYFAAALPAFGKYRIKEITAPKGFKFDDTKYEVIADQPANVFVNIENEEVKQELTDKEFKKKLWEREYICYRIGKMYDKELGTEQNCTVARKYYETAPKNKYVKKLLYLTEKKLLLECTEPNVDISQIAHYKLGKLYQMNGIRNLKKAEEHLFISAGYGNTDAQCALGLLIYKTRSKKEGKDWVKKAAANGNEFAQHIVNRLRGRSTKRYNRPKAKYVNRQVDNLIRNIQYEFERHLRQLQSEYEYENEQNEKHNEEYDYIPYEGLVI